MSSDQRQRGEEKDALSGEGDLHLVITEAGIEVTMIGTNFSVAYRREKKTPWLKVTAVQDDPEVNMKKAAFLAQAWGAASAEAYALGWMGES
jgi:hypothetical protein